MTAAADRSSRGWRPPPLCQRPARVGAVAVHLAGQGCRGAAGATQRPWRSPTTMAQTGRKSPPLERRYIRKGTPFGEIDPVSGSSLRITRKVGWAERTGLRVVRRDGFLLLGWSRGSISVKDWNIAITGRDGNFERATETLTPLGSVQRPFGSIRGNGFSNLLLMRVEDIKVFLESLLRLRSQNIAASATPPEKSTIEP